VKIRAHSVEALTHTDAWGEQDMYWVVSMTPAVGVGDPAHCSTDDEVQDDRNKIEPNWACTIKVSGGPDTTVEMGLERDFRLRDMEIVAALKHRFPDWDGCPLTLR
jgi:hypothetical protein